MKNCLATLAGFFLIALLSQGCRQAFHPMVPAQSTGLLVVEGFINSSQGPTVMRLSRTGDLTDTVTHPEIGALVNVEGDNGSRFTLTENGYGEYNIAQLALDNNIKYRIHIRTRDGREYISDFTPVKYTPAIDSITWQRENGGLTLYANAHDPQNATRYYRWKYEETWEFHSAFYSSLKYLYDSSTYTIIGLAYRNPDQSVDTTIYKCWKTLNTTSIILGSTEKLSSDVVYLPVQYIEPGSEKLSVLYSINLRQYAISHDEYLFLQKMKKNTEQLGSLFDAQPTEISGNFHCLTDTNEPVIGFVEITQEQTKRVFIYNDQISGWNYNSGCILIDLDNNKDNYSFDILPTNASKISSYGIVSFQASTPTCVDCTLKGTNHRPSFWP